MRLLFSLFSLLSFLGGAYWLYTHDERVNQMVQEFLHRGDFHTLEIRYTAEEIMEREKKQLLKESSYSYLPVVTKFYPYALIEMKYSQENQTKEGLMLWGLVDGELVCNTEQWQTTHGFADCMQAKTTKEEFKFLNILAKRGGAADRETVIKESKMSNEALDQLVESCRQKKLVVQQGNRYRLHFSHPKLASTPETKIDQWLVTKPYKGALQAEKRFSIDQIQKTAMAAFDEDFTIRHVTEIYLPIYVISVKTPDGSVLTTHWNALNGKRLSERVGFEPTVPN